VFHIGFVLLKSTAGLVERNRAEDLKNKKQIEDADRKGISTVRS
jgi:hypothetical protein